MSININSTILELSKIDPNKYQTITVDANQKIKVLDVQDGQELYTSGARTSAKQLFDALTVVKIASRTLKANNNENPDENKKSLEILKRIKFELKKNISEQAPTLTPESLRQASLGFNRNPTDRDRVVQNFYLKKSEPHQKTREAYKALEMETRNLRPSSSTAESFTLLGETFQAHRLTPSQKFMAHATSLSNLLPVAEQLQSRASSQPLLCVSLINEHSAFFGSVYGQAALILPIDPRQIVLTSVQCNCSPTNRVQEASLMRQFYNNQERLIILTDRINQIHQLSGLENAYLSYQMLEPFIKETLTELKRDFRFRKDEYEAATSLARRYPDHSIKRAEEAFKESETKLNRFSKLIGIDFRFDFSLPNPNSREARGSVIQIMQLLSYYKSNPEKNNSPEEFLRVFQYPGSKIIEELQKYEQELKHLCRSGVHLERIHKPEELLALTKPSRCGDELYNEINVNLGIPGTRPTTPKGIVLTRKTLEKYTGSLSDSDKVSEKEDPQFLQVIRFAKENNLPIYILEGKQNPRAKL